MATPNDNGDSRYFRLAIDCELYIRGAGKASKKAQTCVGERKSDEYRQLFVGNVATCRHSKIPTFTYILRIAIDSDRPLS